MFLWLHVLPSSTMLAQPSCVTITRNPLTHSREAPSLPLCPSVHAAHPVHRVLSVSLNHTQLSQFFPLWLSSCHRCPPNITAICVGDGAIPSSLDILKVQSQYAGLPLPSEWPGKASKPFSFLSFLWPTGRLWRFYQWLFSVAWRTVRSLRIQLCEGKEKSLLMRHLKMNTLFYNWLQLYACLRITDRKTHSVCIKYMSFIKDKSEYLQRNVS